MPSKSVTVTRQVAEQHLSGSSSGHQRRQQQLSSSASTARPPTTTVLSPVPWSTAYRALGTFMDCTQQQQQVSFQEACPRYMIWAAYHNPEISHTPLATAAAAAATTSNMHKKCHESPSPWNLVGVYRTELVAFLQTFLDHKWSWNQQEYVVTQASLDYLVHGGCGGDGNNSYSLSSWSFSSSDSCVPVTNRPDTVRGDNTTAFFGIQPLMYGRFQLALYNDSTCSHLLVSPPQKDSATTTELSEPEAAAATTTPSLADFALQPTPLPWGKNDNQLSSMTAEQQRILQDWWKQSQEYKWIQLNQVIQTNFFEECNVCFNVPAFDHGHLLIEDSSDSSYNPADQCMALLAETSTHECNPNGCLYLASPTILPIEIHGFRFGNDDNSHGLAMEQEEHSTTTTTATGPVLLLLLLGVLSFGTTIAATIYLSKRVDARQRQQQQQQQQEQHQEFYEDVLENGGDVGNNQGSYRDWCANKRSNNNNGGKDTMFTTGYSDMDTAEIENRVGSYYSDQQWSYDDDEGNGEEKEEKLATLEIS